MVFRKRTLDSACPRAAALPAAVFFLAVGLLACGEPDPTIEFVRELHEQEQYVESIAPLEWLLAERPDEREFLRLYGVALLAISQPAPAIWPLEKLAASPEASLEDQMLLARAHWAGGTPEDAIAAADRVLEQNPNVLEALEVRIVANESLMRHEEALADVETVLSYEPDELAFIQKRASLLLLLERVDDAQVALADLKQRATNSSDGADWTPRSCAIDASFTYERSEGGDLEDAREAWESCLAQFPADPLVVSEALGFFDGRGEPERGIEILRRALEEESENVELKIALSQRLAAQGEYEGAEALLVQATSDSAGAGVPLAWKALADYYAARREYGKARTAVERLMTFGKPSISLRMFYIDMLIRAGDFDEARAAIPEIVQPEFRSLLAGRLLLETGQPREALKQLDEGIRLWPSNSVARQLAAEAAEQLGDYDRAIAEFKEAVRADPANLEALQRLARYLQAMGHVGTLNQLIQGYIRKQPRDPHGYRLWIELARERNLKWTAEPIRQLGQLPGHFEEAVAAGASLRTSQPEEALAHIEKHELDLLAPASREVLAIWVQSQSQLGQHAAALARLNAAMAEQAHVAALHVMYAEALTAAGRPPEEVRASLDRALALEPGSVSALIAMARVRAVAGEVDEALALYDRARAAAPGDEDAAWLAIELLVAQGRNEDVERRTGALLRAHPYHAGVAHLLAYRLALGGNELDRARTYAQRAVRFGGGVEAYTTLGWIQLELGEIENSMGYLRAALEVDPDASSAHYHLGRALARSGDPAAAQTEFEKALAGAAFPEAEAARAELAHLRAQAPL